jgi:hypothetical protein
MRWQSGGFIEIESVGLGREVSDLSQSPQMAITSAATTARNVTPTPALVAIAVIHSGLIYCGPERGPSEKLASKNRWVPFCAGTHRHSISNTFKTIKTWSSPNLHSEGYH